MSNIQGGQSWIHAVRGALHLGLPTVPLASCRLASGTLAVRSLGLFTIMALILLLVSPAFSATINVTANATDALNGANGQCSLREAIQNINDGATTYAEYAAGRGKIAVKVVDIFGSGTMKIVEVRV